MEENSGNAGFFLFSRTIMIYCGVYNNDKKGDSMKKHICLAAVVFLCFSLFAAETTTMYVSTQKGLLKSNSSSSSKTVATLLYGDQVTVLSTQNKWCEIQIVTGTAAGKKGWILSASLTKKKIIAKGSKVTANAAELALAGKGFSSEVEDEYKKSGSADYDAVDRVEEATVSNSEQNAFISSGKLNGGKE